MEPTVDVFLEKLQTLQDEESVRDAMDGQLRSMGFDNFAYMVLRPPAGPRFPNVLTTYPVSWAKHYLENDYINIDAIVPHAAAMLQPFDWRSLNRSREGYNLVFEEAREFGIRNGITAPIHGPGNALSILCVSSDTGEREFNGLVAAHRHTLHLVAFYCHTAMSGCLCQGPDNQIFHPSPRERECLLWTARGKSAWEIAEILGLSHETVVCYLKSAMRKAGVYTKHHAVVKAIMLGIIVP